MVRLSQAVLFRQLAQPFQDYQYYREAQMVLAAQKDLSHPLTLLDLEALEAQVLPGHQGDPKHVI